MDSRVIRPLLGGAACAAALVVLLASAYYVGLFSRLDAAALAGFAGIGPLEGPSDTLVYLADPLPLSLMLLGLCAAAFAWGRRRQAVAAVLLVGAANLTTQLLKLALAHPRVRHVLGPAEQPLPAAFPSGHATAAMTIALAAILVSPRRWRPLAAVVGGAFSLSVSIGVMVLGWHFPSDVLGGCLVATCFGLLSLAGLRAFSQRDPVPRHPARRSAAEALQRRRPLLDAALLAGAGVLALLALANLPELLGYARTHTSSVLAGTAIVVASSALLAAVTVEAAES